MTPAEDAINAYCIDAARFRLMAFDLIDQGKPVEAEGALDFARLCERAAEAEDMDPDTVVGPECICWACRWARISVGLT